MAARILTPGPALHVWHGDWNRSGAVARPARLAAESYVGRNRYFLTFCTFARRPVLVDAQVIDTALAQFRRTASLESFAILAYCFMPDHVHLLVEACADTSDLRRFVKMSKQRSGGAYSRTARQRLWQEGYYDRVLRQDDDAYDMARYISMNPVRAGLAKTPTDYPYQGSDVWDIAWLFAA